MEVSMLFVALISYFFPKDFELERSLLVKEVYPKLRQRYSDKYGVDLTILDPLLGIDPILKNRINYKEYFEEQMNNYCHESPLICPVILMGQKMGLPLLPTTMPVDTFDNITYALYKARKRIYVKENHAIVNKLESIYELSGDQRVLSNQENILELLDTQVSTNEDDVELEWVKISEKLACLLHYGYTLANLHSSGFLDGQDNCMFFEIEYALEMLFASNRSFHQENFSTITKSDQEIRPKRSVPSTEDNGTIPNDEASMTSMSSRSCSGVASRSLFDDSKSRSIPLRYRPILIKRRIVDLHKYLNQSKSADYIDLLPGLNELNQLINSKLQTLVSKLENTWNFEKAENYAEFEIIWKNKDGIDVEFHADYLASFFETFSNLCICQLDSRLDVSQSLYEDRSKVALYDAIWNSVHYARNVAILPGLEELAYRESIESILCYIVDDSVDADAPLLIYSEEKDSPSKEIPSFSHSFSASAFEYIQHYLKKESNDCIFIFRALNQPVKLYQLLIDIATQICSATLMSMNQILPNPQNATFQSIMESLSSHQESNLKLMIIGIEHIQPNINCAMNSSSDTPYLLERDNLPQQLPAGFKMILSTSCVERNSDGSPIPHPFCLNLVIENLKFDPCFHWLNRKLTSKSVILNKAQENELSKLLLNIKQSNLRHFTLKQLFKLFAQSNANEVVLSDTELQRILIENDELFMHNLAALFGKDTISLIIDLLQEKDGFTLNELEDLLSLQNKAVEAHHVKNGKDTLRFPQGIICLILFLLKLNNCKLNSSFDFHQDGYNLHEIKRISDHSTLLPQMLVDYFTGKWSECAKPTTSAQIKRAKRLVPGHITMTTNENSCLFNWRKLRKLPRYLMQSKQYNEACQTVLFNFSWLHAKLTSLGLEKLLEDFDDFLAINPATSESADKFLIAQHSTHLVAQVLRRSQEMIMNYPDCLSVELTGQLLCVANFAHPSEIGEQNWIDYLIRQCDRSAPWQNVFMPSMPFTYSPVSPLLGTFNCNNEIISMFETSCGNLLVKFANESCVHNYNLLTGSIAVDFEIGYGSIHASPNGQFGVVVSKKQNGSLKVYRIDSMTRTKSTLVGIIDTSRWLDPQNTLDSDKDSSLSDISPKVQHSIKTNVVALSMDSKYVGVIVRSNRLKFNVMSNFKGRKPSLIKYHDQVPSFGESLSGGMNNHVLICELETGKPVHILSPSPLATLIKLTEIRKQPIEAYNGLFFTNSGEQLLGFSTVTGEQVMGVNLLSWPRKVLVNLDAKRIFVLCTEATKTVILHMNDKFEVELSYKIVFKNALKDDMIVDCKQAKLMPYLLVQAEKSVVVYDYKSDVIVSHVPQPPGIPKYFKLPNSNYQLLTFKDACFAIDDRLVVAALFRNVVIWDIATSSPLAILHASINLISQLYVGQDGKHLVSYSRPQNQIQLWSLPIAITNAAMLKGMGVSAPPRFEKLTKPIKKVTYIKHDGEYLTAACCEKSDELGIFRVKTGALVDLFTHDAEIKTFVQSKDSNYLIVGINTKVGKSQKSIIIWCLKSRKIVKEFGESCGCLISGSAEGEFYHINDEIDDYSISKYTCSYDQESNSSDMEVHTFKTKLKFVNLSSEPFVLEGPNYLSILCQNTFNGENELVLFDPLNDCVIPISTEKLQDKLEFKSIMSVESGSSKSSLILVLSTSKLISDVHAERIIAEYIVVNGHLSLSQYTKNIPGGPVGSLVLTKSLKYVADLYGNNLLISLNKGDCREYKSMGINEFMTNHLEEDNELTLQAFAFNEELAILSSTNQLLTLRLSTLTICGTIITPEVITCVSIHQPRTVLVGFQDGSVSIYELIDPVLDGPTAGDLQTLVDKIPSRSMTKFSSDCFTPMTSSTDTSSTIIWPSEPETSWVKQEKKVKSDDKINLMKTQVRLTPAELQWQKSDTLWNMMNERSKTCTIM